MNLYLQAYQQPLAKWLLEILTSGRTIAVPIPIGKLFPMRPAVIIVQANASPMPDAENPAGEAAAHTALMIKNNNETELLHFQEIIWLQSDSNGVKIQTIRKKYLLYRSLRSIEQELDSPQFVRIHRSAIVNRTFIQSIRQLPGGDGYVALTTGEEIRYSRNYKRQLIG